MICIAELVVGIQQKGAPIQQLVVGMAYLGKIYIVREETSSKQIIYWVNCILIKKTINFSFIFSLTVQMFTV